MTVLAVAIAVVLVSATGCATHDDPVRSFTILQFNDVYEIFPLPAPTGNGYEARGGLAHAASLVRAARQRGPVLVLHAGDFLSPSLLSIKFKYKGAQMIDAMNAMDLDGVTLGNHEFDFGCRALADRIRQSTFRWIAANVQLPPSMDLGESKVVPFEVLNAGGLRVGVFGLTLPQAPVSCDPGDIAFTDPLTTAAAVVDELKRLNVDLIVALTHLPMEQDRALAAARPEIDIIVGGHDHDVMVDLVGRTLITKAGANATMLGRIDVKAMRSHSGWIVEKGWWTEDVIPEAVPADARVARVLAPYAKELEALETIIGRSEVPLDVREGVVRDAESNFGNYIADLMRAEMRTDVAIVNGGALRADRVIPPGPLTVQDLETALVFQNRLVAVEITGEQLVRALENGVSRAGQRDGRFPQISGLSFVFDVDAPPGRRVVRVLVGKAPLDRDRRYTLATIDFLTTPGNVDGYTLPSTHIDVRGELTQLVLREVANKPIRTETDGRIVQRRQPRR